MLPTRLDKPSKYRNRKTRMGDRTFDSKLEAERWLVLKDKQKRVEIYSLVCQPSFTLYAYSYQGKNYEPSLPVCVYQPDFQYTECRDGGDKIVAEDCKGVSTALFTLKAKLFRANYPNIELRIIKAKDVAS